ncbi:hypothetical protein GCM10010398_44890 [Streptomyces fimbriatus]
MPSGSPGPAPTAVPTRFRSPNEATGTKRAPAGAAHAPQAQDARPARPHPKENPA